MTPSVFCIVLNWNNWQDTSECLASLAQVEYDNLSVIVVDNCSSNDSVARLRALYPDISLIKTQRNLGFAGGNNVGIREALKRAPDYIWLLNNDAIPQKDALAALVSKAEANRRLGGVGSVLMYPHTDETQAWGGGKINIWTGRTRHAHSPHSDEWFDYITAASILIRRDAIEDVGLLDEGFFLYWEDTDYSYRLRKAGWQLGVAASSIVIHKENASTRGQRSSFDRYATESTIRFLRKHSPVPYFSIPSSLLLKIVNSLLTLRFRRIGDISSGAKTYLSGKAVRSTRPAQDSNSPSTISSLPILINASRIGPVGGLHTFALDVLSCVSRSYPHVNAILPAGTEAPKNVVVYEVPGWIGSSARVLKIRPIVWWLYMFVFSMRHRSCRILSTTHHALPLAKRQIVTVHDLRPYFLPDNWIQKAYFHFLLPGILRRCDSVITVSETSKKTIVSTYGIAEDKVHVVHNAVAQRAVSIEAPALNEDQSRFLLMVGASWPHKNAAEVLQNHALWKQRYRLKILMGAGQYREYLQHLAKDLKIESQVDFLINIADSELDLLYRNCSALIYPSRMEGFGLPPLEAMAYGKVTIVSDIPVFRELFGEVPIYVELGNKLSWEKALDELENIQLSGSLKRQIAGQKLAASFTRERMTVALTKAIESGWHISIEKLAAAATAESDIQSN